MTIMNDETREFVAMHRNEDVRELALKAKRVEGLDLPLALDQIAGWQIARKNCHNGPPARESYTLRTFPWNSAHRSSQPNTSQKSHKHCLRRPQPCAPECPILENRTTKPRKVSHSCPILPNRSCKRQKVRSSCPILQNRTRKR